MKKIVFVLVMFLSLPVFGREFIAKNTGEKVQVTKVSLDKYGPGLDWYAEKYPDQATYCDGMPPFDRCEGSGPECISPDFDFLCEATPEEIKSFTPKQITDLMNALAFGGMEYDRRARSIVEYTYKDLYENSNSKYVSIKEFAYSRKVLEKISFSDDIPLYIPQNLPYYKEVIIHYLKKNTELFRKLPENVRGDKEIALAALNRTGENFKYLSEKLRDDKAVVLTVLNTATSNYYDAYISPRLLKDPDILAAQARYPENKRNGEKRFLEAVERDKKKQIERNK